MQYDLKIEEVSISKRKLHFAVHANEVKKEMDVAYSELSAKVRLPGFRKGKAPRWLLEKRFSKNIKADVADKLVQRGFSNVDIPHVIVGRPALEDMSELSQDDGLTFTVAVEIRPEITVENYEGLEIEFEASEVSDAEIEEALTEKLRSKGRIEDAADDAAIGEKDFVLVSLKLTDGDETLADEAGTMINMGNEQFYPGIETLLLGMKKGEKKTAELSIGDNSVFEHLKGKSGQADLEIQSIQAYVIPELTDELAKEFGHDTVDAFNVSIAEEKRSQREGAAKDQARVSILQKLVEANEFDIPSAMVDEQMKALMEELSMRRIYAGEDARKIKFSDEELADLRNRANFAAKAACILAAIARQEKVTVAPEDIEEKIESIASMRGQTSESIRAYIQSEGADNVLRERILEEKTLEVLFEKATLIAPQPIATKKAPAKKSAAKKAPAKKAAAKKAPAKKAATKTAAEKKAPAKKAPAKKAAAKTATEKKAPAKKAPAKKAAAKKAPAKKAPAKKAATKKPAAKKTAAAKEKSTTTKKAAAKPKKTTAKATKKDGEK